MDGRNIYEPQRMEELGFTYRGIGRYHKKSELAQTVDLPVGSPPPDPPKG